MYKLSNILLIGFLAVSNTVYSQDNYEWEKVYEKNNGVLYALSVVSTDTFTAVIGGFDGHLLYKGIRLYNNSNWDEIDTFNHSGGSTVAMLAFYLAPYLYVGAGRVDNKKTINKDFWRYDLKKRTCQKLNDLPFTNFGSHDVHMINGVPFLIMEEMNDYWDEMAQTRIFTYNVTEDRWDFVSTFPDSILKKPVSFAIGSKIYLYFQNNRYAIQYSRQFHCYDTEADTWERKTDFPGPERTLAFACSDGYYGFVGGGSDVTKVKGTAEYADVYRYEPVQDQWKRIKDLPVPVRWSIGWHNKYGTYVGFGIHNNDMKRTGIWKIIEH